MNELDQIIQSFGFLSSEKSEIAKIEIVERLDKISSILEDSDLSIEETALAISIISKIADQLRY